MPGWGMRGLRSRAFQALFEAGSKLFIDPCGFRAYRATRQGEPKSASQFIAALKQCGRMRDLVSGKKVHRDAIEAGYHTNKFVASVLVSMYSKCRNMALAQEVFDSVVDPDVVAWTSLILGYVENGKSSVAMDLFASMNCEPTSVTYVAALKACGALASERLSEKELYLQKGIDIHKQVRDHGFQSDIVVATTLVDMYSKCGSMQHAKGVFDEMAHRNVVTWTSLIKGYVDNGESSVALDAFASMDCKPDPVTYAAALKACGVLASEKESEKESCLTKGIAMHREVRERGFGSDLVLGNTLVGMYSKCGSMQRAREAFNSMRVKDGFTWNTLILGYVENGENAAAMDLFSSIGCEPNSFTYVAALKACAGLAADSEADKRSCLHKGIAIHKQVRGRGIDSNIAVANSLVGLYIRCGSMHQAREVFERMTTKDVVTWNTLILGYAENGECSTAMDLFTSMDCTPSSITFMAALKACRGLASLNGSEKSLCLEKGIAIHKQVNDHGFESNLAVATSLLDMYSGCGSMQHARGVFDKMCFKDVVTWNSLILGYVENEESSVAMDLFSNMDCDANCVTYVAVLKACGALASLKDSEKQVWLEKGIALHRQVEERGYDTDIVVATTLVDMYSKCGSMHRARGVFDRMRLRNVVTWTSLMLGYVENGENYAAMDLFASLDCDPNFLTCVAALKACGGLAHENLESEKQLWLDKGILIHKEVEDRGLGGNIIVGNALVGMYSQCSSMQRAKETFDRMASKDVVTWTSLILGYVENGKCSSAMDAFTSMDCKPDAVTYVAALKACGGLTAENDSEKESYLAKGIEIHKQVKDRGFDADIVVANSLVGMYGKLGCMESARKVFTRMVTKDIVSWNSLILGYLENGEASIALDLFARMDCDPNSATYVAAVKACGVLAALGAGQQIHAIVCKLGLEQNRVLATALVDLYGKCGSMATAEELFNNMHSADTVVWKSLIAGFGSYGDPSRVFELSNKMQEAGLPLDGATFVSILSVCSHAGLLKEGNQYFDSMSGLGITKGVEHYNCMVDLLGRANKIQDALDLVKNMPPAANTVTWMTLLGACKIWNNVEVGKIAFDALVALGTEHPASYVLMRDIYRQVSCNKANNEKLKELPPKRLVSYQLACKSPLEFLEADCPS